MFYWCHSGHVASGICLYCRFDEYIDPLKVYLLKYRESESEKVSISKGEGSDKNALMAPGSEGLQGHPGMHGMQSMQGMQGGMQGMQGMQHGNYGEGMAGAMYMPQR